MPICGPRGVRRLIGVAGLPALQDLDLTDTEVTELKGLAALKGLRQLTLTHTPVQDRGLREVGALPPTVAGELIDALVLWRRLRGMLALLVDGPFDEDAATPPLKELLARSAQCVDFTSLNTKISATADRVLAHFQALVEHPASGLASTAGEDTRKHQQETGL